MPYCGSGAKRSSRQVVALERHAFLHECHRSSAGTGHAPAERRERVGPQLFHLLNTQLDSITVECQGKFVIGLHLETNTVSWNRLARGASVVARKAVTVALPSTWWPQGKCAAA